MMEGITILNQIPLTIGDKYALVCFLVAIVIIVTAIGIALHSNNIWVIGSMAIVLTLCIVGLIVIPAKLITPAQYKYQVTISDEVNFTEFNTRYNVIDRQGQIYTIEEIAPNK